LSDPCSRLLECFAVVFPELNEVQILGSSVDSVPDWDSLASVTLYSLIEEEFGVEIDIDDLDGLISFEGILNYITAIKRITENNG